MRSLCFLVFTLLTLNACGSSGSQSQTQPPDAPAPPPETEQPCSTASLPVTVSSEASSASETYHADNAADGDTSGSSRWQSDFSNESLVLDFGQQRQIGSLQIKWFKGNERTYRFSVESSSDAENWRAVVTNDSSSGRHSGFELISFDEPVIANYMRITGSGNSVNDATAIVEIDAYNCEQGDGEIIDVFPNEVGIELLDWYVSVPTDEDGSGTADSIYENELAAGYTNSEYFYASDDAGIVMRSPSYGFKTSQNTSYVRVELREMLRRGDKSIRTQGVNKNNWVFSSAPQSAQASAGGVDGKLEVELAVNEVSTTGENYQIGRVIIGQIHANDDEPIRLYYRKLPGNEKGAIYYAHEKRASADGTREKQEDWVEMIGSRSSSASDPSDGIALNEPFRYIIEVSGNTLFVTISREGKADVVSTYDMTGSRYDEPDQYMYFKVGVYHVNNSSDADERAKVTVYEIKNSHTHYAESE
ncbi:polysaccharide lyase family 7 protein [Alteromonas halophila]|uniref:F5/8 type C domain-containing protein n=1 Tax=Alteromonas halophila TaxID=516698 RepID=A0A918JED8_9ALTE|nr:polysaccharide lyase family 7 protein [Alteromonas halophila]GGW76663.1 hypothetical protein GCM10007391_06740 [Alteromonas halophila]